MALTERPPLTVEDRIARAEQSLYRLSTEEGLLGLGIPGGPEDGYAQMIGEQLRAVLAQLRTEKK